jgi:hypothetical protein
LKDVHNESRYLQELHDEPVKIQYVVSKLAYPNRSRESVAKIFSYIFLHIRQRASSGEKTNTYRLIDICCFVLQEINSQSGFLDSALVKFLKALIQKTLTGDQDVLKESEVWWMNYFLVSLACVDGISVRVILASVVEPLFLHLVETPTKLDDPSIRGLCQLFCEFVISVYSPIWSIQSRPMSLTYLLGISSLQTTVLVGEDSLNCMFSVIAAIDLLLNQKCGFQELFQRLLQTLCVENPWFITSFRPDVLLKKLSTLNSNLPHKKELIQRSKDLTRLEGIQGDGLDYLYALLASSNPSLEHTIMCRLSIQCMESNEEELQQFFATVTAKILDGNHLPNYHLGHILYRYQGHFLLPLLRSLRGIMESNMNMLQKLSVHALNASQIDIVALIVTKYFGYSFGSETAKSPRWEALVECCKHLTIDLEWFLKNATGGNPFLAASYHLRIALLRALASFALRFSDAVPLCPLLQTLFSLLKTPFLQDSETLFEITFDITGALLDELPKNQQGELVQWVNENMNSYSQPNRIQARINTLLPFPKELFASQLLNCNDSELRSRPWELIQVGASVPKNQQLPWNHPTALQQLNSTCISLDKLNAKRLRPDPPTYELLYANGWRPLTNDVATPQTTTKFQSIESLANKRALEDTEELQVHKKRK